MGHPKTRRHFLMKLGGGLASLPLLSSLPLRLRLDHKSLEVQSASADPRRNRSTELANGMAPVMTPGIPKLDFTWEGETKVFQLTAEPVRIFFPDMSDATGKTRRPILAWGYNGSVTGPTIEVTEGDHVRILVTNRLPEPTSIHWHGLHVPNAMDGVTGITQEPIQPGETFVYEFTLEQHGTYFYHPHFMTSKQVGMGLAGFFIVHPNTPEPWQLVDHDYGYFLQTWKIHPGSPTPDTLEMNDANYFTLNGRAGPDVVPMQARSGERVRIRVANLSLMAHPVHLHGHSFRITDYGAGFVPEHQHLLANTNSVSAGESRAFDFTAGKPGRWVFHCHFLHHVMNDMHRTPIPGQPNHSGHEMGGMLTWIDVTG